MQTHSVCATVEQTPYAPTDKKSGRPPTFQFGGE